MKEKEITENQIDNLICLIFYSKEIDKFTKAILVGLVNASENLTKSVKFTVNLLQIIDNRLFGVRKINHHSSETKLEQFFELIGTDFRFSEFEKISECTHTIYFSNITQDFDAKEIEKNLVFKK